VNGKLLAVAKRLSAAMLCASLFAGCGTRTPIAPGSTRTPVTNLPPTSRPPTSAPALTPTTTSGVTATPVLSANAGRIEGRVTYKVSGKPAPGFSVGLGTTAEDIQGSALKRFVAQSWTKTDTNGHFVLDNVETGKWIVGVNDPLVWVVFPWDAVSIDAGTTVTVEFKVSDRDLSLISPTNKSVLDTKTPVLRWAPYSDAVSYRVKLFYLPEDGTARDVSKYVLPLDRLWITAHKYVSPYSSEYDEPGRTTATEMEVTQVLPPGRYQWSVTAYDYSADTLAYCDCGGNSSDDNRWGFGISGARSLVVWSDSYDYSDKPRLTVYNNTGQDLTLALAGYGVVTVASDHTSPLEGKEIEMSTGTYPYTATIANLASFSGAIEIGQKGPLVLTFEVSAAVSK
jgi:hypothetical protein